MNGVSSTPCVSALLSRQARIIHGYSSTPDLRVMICSTLLPLTPKSLPPFGGQTQPAHVLLKFADSRRALLTVVM